ncbi:MAG: RsmD family RNA methyltransferase, partial [Acidimicrobiales bacterium]
RSLRAPAGTATRPTGDRVREAIFDVLGSLVDLEGLDVLDLFAGSGALGIEALSRGAASAAFVDRSPAALSAVRANLASTGLEDGARVVRADAVGWLAGPHRFDLALCDPPYEFTQWPAILERLQAPLVVLESAQPVELSATWEVSRHKRYGSTLVTVVRRVPQDPTDKKGTT